MTHVYCLGALLGRPGDRALAEAGLAALPARSGTTSTAAGSPASTPRQVDARKECYTHAFVVLAGSSAVVADLPGAAEFLDGALADLARAGSSSPADGMFLDAWDADFSVADPYRGVNANMHAVEALLAAADAPATTRCGPWPSGSRDAWRWTSREPQRVADPRALRRGLAPAARAPPRRAGAPLPAVRRHGRPRARVVPAARELEAALGADAPGWLVTSAASLFDRAVADGWDADGAEGFVYTTDWSGRPVVRDRMHWVVAEALAAAATLHQRTGDARYAELGAAVVGLRRALPPRPRPGLLAPPARRRQPADRHGLARASPTSTTRSRPSSSRGSRSPRRRPWPCGAACSTTRPRPADDPPGPSPERTTAAHPRHNRAGSVLRGCTRGARLLVRTGLG